MGADIASIGEKSMDAILWIFGMKNIRREYMSREVDKLRSCPFCKSDNVKVFNVMCKPIEIVCNECHSISPNIEIEKQTGEQE